MNENLICRNPLFGRSSAKDATINIAADQNVFVPGWVAPRPPAHLESEADQRSHDDAYLDIDRVFFYAPKEAAMKNGCNQHNGTIRSDGQVRLLHAQGKVICDEHGTHKALRESEKRYRELFENSKDALYVHNMSGQYTSVNRAAEKLSGYSREEIIGKYFWDFVPPEYTKQVRENLCKKLEEVGETTYEVEIITKQGRRIPVEVSSRLIYEAGLPVGVQGSVRNITERKESQETLRTYSR